MEFHRKIYVALMRDMWRLCYIMLHCYIVTFVTLLHYCNIMWRLCYISSPRLPGLSLASNIQPYAKARQRGSSMRGFKAAARDAVEVWWVLKKRGQGQKPPLCNDGLCLISPRVQFKCGGDWRRSGAKAVMMVRVCLISVEGEQNIVTAWLDWRRRCGPNSIFPYLSKFMNSWILEWKRMLWFIIVSTINSFQTFQKNKS